MTRLSSSAINAAIIAGCFIALVGFGMVAAFGVFLRPMSEALGWSREVFSLSIAVQLLCWGLTQPFAGIVADRRGTGRVLAFGALMAALGFWIRGVTESPEVFVASGVIVGIGTGASSFPVVIVALGKIVAPERRPFVMGLGTAAASTGMLLGAPLSVGLMSVFGWQAAILIIAASFLLILPAVIFIARVSAPTASASSGGVGDAVRMAFSDRSYVLLFFGFFVCGFHVAFIQTHLPAYLQDEGLGVAIGGISLALLGLFNIVGSFGAGWSGQHLSSKNVLAGIYAGRAVVITAFILLPISFASVVIFSSVMGLLWLATVPLTTGLVAKTQGLRFLSTLAGLVFLSHQTGSFVGAWLGGRLYDATGSYDAMWWTAIALGLLATLLHLPIRETPGPLARAES
ncbi:MFS transporter [Pseudaestuariivita atlantica]|uniref:MFS transporter n=1 Tax=Pseudaestuariivita atlantica TaxID=1317121 RepID=A0A0L1JUJ0_9RHOB|nr:MFS transporter [Pseudaestuariivita atlantica]KNG95424.1 MFS transporter [Pseudaestuariivita atlantica]